MKALNRFHVGVDRGLALLLLALMTGFTAFIVASGDLPGPLLAMLVIGWVEVAALAWLLWIASPKAERLDARDNALADAGRWEDAR